MFILEPHSRTATRDAMELSSATHLVNSIALRVDNLGRTVSGKILLENISFSVPPRETLAIVGPSGSGKSTLLRLLNRLDEPTTGTVFLDGVDYRELPPRELRRRIGMVTQRPYLFPGTVADNLQFGPRQREQTLSDTAIERLLGSVGLPDYALRDVANLSGGEAQRVSFARTLANEPEILLLDEPSSALDESSKHGIESLIQTIMGKKSDLVPGSDEVQHQPLSCVLVTHDMAQASRLAQYAIALAAGHIVKSGRIEEVFRVEDPVS